MKNIKIYILFSMIIISSCTTLPWSDDSPGKIGGLQKSPCACIDVSLKVVA